MVVPLAVHVPIVAVPTEGSVFLVGVLKSAAAVVCSPACEEVKVKLPDKPSAVELLLVNVPRLSVAGETLKTAIAVKLPVAVPVVGVLSVSDLAEMVQVVGLADVLLNDSVVEPVLLHEEK